MSQIQSKSQSQSQGKPAYIAIQIAEGIDPVPRTCLPDKPPCVYDCNVH